jgi:orotate phosphoribosyltransferase
VASPREKWGAVRMTENPRISERERLREIIRRRSLLETGEFRLASGRSSGYFFDMKKTMFDPEGAALLSELLFDMVKEEEADGVGGTETGGIPLVALLCRRSWPERPLKGFFVRKERKGHGTDRPVEGLLARGDAVIVCEDVTTTGGSAMAAVEAARQAGARIVKVVTVVDRLEGAAANFAREGLRFEALYTRGDFT